MRFSWLVSRTVGNHSQNTTVRGTVVRLGRRVSRTVVILSVRGWASERLWICLSSLA